MAVDSTKLIIPGHGAVYQAAQNTSPGLNPLSKFSLMSTTVSGWTHLGHTSKANTIAFSKEGGEPTSLDTFLADAVRVINSSNAWSVTVPALQFDENVLDLAFNGDWDAATGGYVVPGTTSPVETALFIYFEDNTGSLGFWLPSTSVTLGEAPSVDTENFLELPLSASILSVDDTVMPTVDGKPGIMQIFKTGLAAPAAPWAASTAYSLNDRVSLAGGAILVATTAGTSGSTAPTAPGAVGGTVTDGTVVWTRQA